MKYIILLVFLFCSITIYSQPGYGSDNYVISSYQICTHNGKHPNQGGIPIPGCYITTDAYGRQVFAKDSTILKDSMLITALVRRGTSHDIIYIDTLDVSGIMGGGGGSGSSHDPVTLSGPYDYITLSGQDIIRGQIDLTTDVTGRSLTLSGSDPVLTFDDTDLGGQDYSFRSDAGVFYLRNVTGATDHVYIDSDGRFGLGAMAPNEAKMFIYGGVSGANVDIRADDLSKSATLEVQSSDFETTFQSTWIQQSGPNVPGNAIDAIPNAGLGRLVFQASDNALIYTAAEAPLIFGTDFTERFRIDGTTGISTFLYDIVVPDEAYGVGWNGSFEVPTKDALYDKIETVIANAPDSLGRNGTAGQLVYETDTKASDSKSTLFWNSSTDRLGIGLNAPSTGLGNTYDTKVHVRGSGTSTSGRTAIAVENLSANSAALFHIENSAGNYAALQVSGPSYSAGEKASFSTKGLDIRFGTDGNVPSGGTHDIIFGTGGYTAATQDFVIYTSEQTVGIGTLLPNQTLEVDGTMRLTGSDGTAITIMGRDADGDISAITVGTGLDLTAGTLTSTITDTHIGNTDLLATGHRLIDFDNYALTIFDVSNLVLTSTGNFTLTGAGSQFFSTNAGIGMTANGLRNITMDADSAVYISTWSGNIELASGEDFVIQTYGATLNDLRFDIDGGIFFVNELPELTTPTDTLLVRSGTGELMWMHAQALRQFGSTGEVGWADPLWDDNYGNYFVAVTQGSVSSPADGEVPVYNSGIFGFEMKQPIGASEAYGSGWNGSTGIPTKNDVYDEIQTLPRLTTVNAYTSQQYFTQATLTDGANISWNLNTQQVGQVTLGGNRTLDNPTNQVAGGHYTIIIKQDGSGNRTLAYGSAYKFPGGVDPTLSTGISAVDVMTCVSDGTNMYCNLLNDYQ